MSTAVADTIILGNAEVEIAAGAGDRPAPTISIVAYGGDVMTVPGWGPVAIDLAGLDAGGQIPLLADHDARVGGVVGHGAAVVRDGRLVVTGVVSGAGVAARQIIESRAADTHLILRAHEESKAVGLDAAIRSWPPIEPVCLRRECYVWDLAPDLDPALLKSDRPSRRRKVEPEEEPGKLAEPPWDAARFVREFIGPEAKTRAAVIEDAIRAGLSERRAERLLLRAEDMGLAHRWKFDSNAPVKYATVSQPLMDVGTTSKPVKKRKRK